MRTLLLHDAQKKGALVIYAPINAVEGTVCSETAKTKGEDCFDYIGNQKAPKTKRAQQAFHSIGNQPSRSAARNHFGIFVFAAVFSCVCWLCFNSYGYVFMDELF